jgi:hypothetical protein
MSAMKVFCIICGKPPQEKTKCPICGVENICKYHVQKFYTDREKSPMGCPKCAPKCSSCGAQTPLSHYKNRPVCTSCKAAFETGEVFRKERQKQIAIKIQIILTSLLTIIGLGVGIYLGFQPYFQKLVYQVTKVKMALYIIVPVWGMIGLIAGQLVATLLNALVKHE